MPTEIFRRFGTACKHLSCGVCCSSCIAILGLLIFLLVKYYGGITAATKPIDFNPAFAFMIKEWTTRFIIEIKTQDYPCISPYEPLFTHPWNGSFKELFSDGKATAEQELDSSK